MPRLLDIKMSVQGLANYHKNTHVGQYVHYDSFTPWSYKINWIRSLVTGAKCICSVILLSEEVKKIKKFTSWNGFPKSILTLIIKRALKNSIIDNHTDDDNDIV